jgi:hypothetical protein
MSESDKINELLETEWRKLGFYYDRDDQRKEWRLIGSKKGLLGFARLLLEYVANPRNAIKSEHEHYGPYSYLEVMTWDKPGIDDHSIHGSLSDLKQLSILIEQSVTSAKVGSSVPLGKKFVENPKYNLVFEVREENFNPASADPSLSS